MKPLKNYKGCYLHDDGYIYKRVTISLEQDIKDSDLKKLKYFLEKHFIKSNKNKILLKTFHLKYELYCNDKNIIAVNKSNLIFLLKKIGVNVKRESVGNVVYLDYYENNSRSSNTATSV